MEVTHEYSHIEGARACCEINLDSLAHNIEYLTSLLAPPSRLWPVVKANAYGHDAVRVVHFLEGLGVARMCVSNLGEAEQLRHAGVGTPLLIMGPLDTDEMRIAAELSVSATVMSLSMLEALAMIADERSMTSDPLRVHLKLDSGMGRWGIAPSRLTEALAAIDAMVARGGVRLEGFMTHFATADHDDRTFFNEQLVAFRTAAETVRERYPSIIVHAANSAATLLEPQAHFDAVRCGVAIYGLTPNQSDVRETELRPVMSLRSQVADIKILEPGESSGYNRTFIADRTTRIALVPIGYGDGYPRLLSGRSHVTIRGYRFPVVGTISMDHCSVQVDDRIRIGDPVTLLGTDRREHITAEDLAALSETINYEITCGIACEPRLDRRFVASDRHITQVG